MCARRKLCGDVFRAILVICVAAAFEILVKVAAKNHTALGAEGTDWHRTTYIVCSIVLSQGVAVVWGVESVYREEALTHTQENKRERGGLALEINTGWGMCDERKSNLVGGGGPGVKPAFFYHQLSPTSAWLYHHKIAGYQVRGVCTLFLPVDAHF